LIFFTRTETTSKVHWELVRSASESADPLSVSPLQISVHSKSPNSPRSPNHVGSSKGDSSKGIPKKGSPLMHERHFFLDEIVKKARLAIIEKKKERLRGSLDECFNSGLITIYQMMKGFERISESLDYLALDVPDVRNNSQIFTLRELSLQGG
jgi:hypothetical protein